MKIVLPTLNQFKSRFKNGFVLSTARAYCITLVNFRFLAWFFESDQFLLWCWITLWTAILMTPVELEHRVCFQAKTIHSISSNHPFPTMATHLLMNMHTLPSGLLLHPA